MTADPELIELRAELELACELARQAGQAIMQHYQAGFAVQYKDAADTDPVTQADKDANALIVAGLAQAFPDDGILAEESPDTEARLSRRRLWCIDPLDGTRDFVAKNGMFVVMIGLAIEQQARLGVVYQPTEDALFWGVGRTAMAEVKGVASALRPSSIGNPAEARMVVSRSHRSKTVTRVAHTLGVPGERPMGSVGLKVVEIAAGNAEIYISTSDKTHEWDACGPEAILRAAGGRMTTILGAPLLYNKTTTNTPHGMLATNEPLHDPCVAALAPIAREKHWQ